MGDWGAVEGGRVLHVTSNPGTRGFESGYRLSMPVGTCSIDRAKS